MPYPKWKYTLDPADGLRATLVGTEEAETALGDVWVDDPKSLDPNCVPCGGPADASGRVAFGPAPVAPGMTKAAIG